MVRFKATIQKFQKKGEKTGWSYIEVDAPKARKLNPESKVSFRVKGKLDAFEFNGMALLPMGKGDFILPLKADVRKKIQKKQGDALVVEMEHDKKPFAMSHDLIKCLKAEPAAYAFFKKLPGSHQKYFSKWIEGAKTVTTKARRIVMAVEALAFGKGYADMLRANRKER